MNYALDTPVKRSIHVPDEQTAPFAPAPPPNGEVDQSNRAFQWLLHKPQNHAIFPIEAQSGRKNLEKKK